MGWFKKKRDPISEKARALTAEIESLEAQIKKLSDQAAKPHPRFRSSAIPGQRGSTSATHEPIFEEVGNGRPAVEALPTGHYNELGVRKYDVTAAWRRLKGHFKAPAASNPKLVNYLAAGSIQGLRPLRYEKRVARNRFIFLVIVLVLVLWGILAVIFHR